MLKPVSTGTASLLPSPSSSRQLLIDTTPQTPAGPMPFSSGTGSANQRQGHVARDTAVNDARQVPWNSKVPATNRNALRSPTPDATATPTRLIEISPEKKLVSKNANLLIDIDVNTTVPEVSSGYKSHARAASSRGTTKAKMDLNLLD
jgi:hypothetical protein